MAKVGNDFEDGSEEASDSEGELELASNNEDDYTSDTNEEDEDGEATDRETDKVIISKYVEEDKLLNWFQAVKGNPVNTACKLIRIMQASGQKQELFQMNITLGNQMKAFKDDNGNIVQVKQLQLLQDVKHHWDSLFLMLKCMKELQPVQPLTLRALSSTHNIRYLKTEITHLALPEDDWNVLDGLCVILEVRI